MFLDDYSHLEWLTKPASLEKSKCHVDILFYTNDIYHVDSKPNP